MTGSSAPSGRTHHGSTPPLDMGFSPPTAVGEHALGQAGHPHLRKLEALRLVDGHDLHRVVGGQVRLGQLFLGLLDEAQVLDERRQTGVALDRRELLDAIEEPQQVLAAAGAGRGPQVGAADDALGQIEHRQVGGGIGQRIALTGTRSGSGRRQVGLDREVGHHLGGCATITVGPRRAGVAGQRREVAHADAVSAGRAAGAQRDRRVGVGQQLEPRQQVDDLGTAEQPADADDVDGNVACAREPRRRRG